MLLKLMDLGLVSPATLLHSQNSLFLPWGLAQCLVATSSSTKSDRFALLLFYFYLILPHTLSHKELLNIKENLTIHAFHKKVTLYSDMVNWCNHMHKQTLLR